VKDGLMAGGGKEFDEKKAAVALFAHTTPFPPPGRVCWGRACLPFGFRLKLV
jgi:hypothetical protein